MLPTTPVLVNRFREGPPEVIFAEHQPPYIPLPAVQVGHRIITKWKLTWGERIKVLLGGSLWLSMLTFKKYPMPVKLQVSEPVVVREYEDTWKLVE